MEKQEAIEMLQNLIANIESDHVSIVEIKGESSGSLSWLTLILSESRLSDANKSEFGIKGVKVDRLWS